MLAGDPDRSRPARSASARRETDPPRTPTMHLTRRSALPNTAGRREPESSYSAMILRCHLPRISRLWISGASSLRAFVAHGRGGDESPDFVRRGTNFALDGKMLS